jgi:hypothetical protein
MTTSLWIRCFACGHRLAFASDYCPQCRAHLGERKRKPKSWPDRCECKRCTAARAELPEPPQ